MECTFHVGQKVTLVDVSERANGLPRKKAMKLGASYPVEGGVYTIREVYLTKHYGIPALLLHEIDNRHIEIAGREPGFEASRFRPVVTRTTDISIFRSMLNPSRVNEEA